MYNKPEYKKNRIFHVLIGLEEMIKSCGKKFAIVNSVRMIYLEE